MFVGYNFISDENSGDPSQVDISTIHNVKIQNGIFDELLINQESNSNYNTNKETWSIYTRLLCTFSGNLLAGNVDFAGENVEYIRVKRRKIEDFEWWTLTDIPYDDILDFETFDFLAGSNQEYEYALLPVLADGTEGDYITSTIFSEFYSTFIVDKDKSYKLFYDLEFGNTERVTKTGIFEPIGSKYPIVVSNSQLNYERGSINATILSPDIENNYGKITPKKEVEYRKAILDFFTNKMPKLLKTHNSEIKIIMIVDNPNPNIEFFNDLNQEIAKISLSWIEVGDSQNKEDMYYANLIERIDV